MCTPSRAKNSPPRKQKPPKRHHSSPGTRAPTGSRSLGQAVLHTHIQGNVPGTVEGSVGSNWAKSLCRGPCVLAKRSALGAREVAPL